MHAAPAWIQPVVQASPSSSGTDGSPGRCSTPSRGLAHLMTQTGDARERIFHWPHTAALHGRSEHHPARRLTRGVGRAADTMARAERAALDRRTALDAESVAEAALALVEASQAGQDLPTDHGAARHLAQQVGHLRPEHRRAWSGLVGEPVPDVSTRTRGYSPTAFTPKVLPAQRDLGLDGAVALFDRVVRRDRLIG
jgi:hypothetical protein